MSEWNKMQVRANNTAAFGSGQKLLLLQTLLSKNSDSSKSTKVKKGENQICCFVEYSTEQVENPEGKLSFWLTDR